MAEREEHPDESVTPAAREPAAASTPAPTPAAESPPPPAERVEYERPRQPGRFQRWSQNGPVRLGAVALVAGLVGGLVGGGIVAAVSDDGHDHGGSVRFVPGGYGFRGPQYRGQMPYRGQDPYRRFVPRGVPRPVQPPVATPTPKATG